MSTTLSSPKSARASARCLSSPIATAARVTRPTGATTFSRWSMAARARRRARAGEIALLIGPAARAHDILFSTRILKKTGLRLAG
jgi:type IV secretory pathway TrbL component